MEHRSPSFTTTRLPPTPPRDDPRTVVAPLINWPRIDRHEALQHELTLRAIAWVLADRTCDDLSATLARAKDAADTITRNTTPDEHASSLFTRLEGARVNFKQACRQYEECDEEFRQAARKLVDALESPLP
jgi:hypothetical protein